MLAPFAALPAYTLAALVVLLAYAIQTEVRFGRKARTMRTGAADRNSTWLLSICAAVPVLGFVFAIKPSSPQWYRAAVSPGMPAVAWAGVILGVCGIALRLWSVLTLRERYTRTLRVDDEQSIERGGPYRFVRHPGYLGSLLVLNGVALASGNWIALVASLIATIAAYAYRIKVEDQMLVSALGDAYAEYRREVGALLPRVI